MTIEEFYPLFLNQHQAFSTDSRKIQSGDIFFALKGDSFNGNKYAAQCLKQGASYVIVDEEIEDKNDQTIMVADVLTFIQELATYHRRQFNIPIVAIAGSNGKTTTKELLISVLSKQFKTHATAGNFNNHIGVPLTLLSMPLDTEIGLIEIGTNAFGEIAFLSKMVEPSHGIITNIGKEHLEGFGDIEGVAREESELFHYLMKHEGIAFVNGDDMYLNRMAHRLTNKITYSISNAEVDVYGEVLNTAPDLKIAYHDVVINSMLSGLHNAQNIIASVAIGSHFGIQPSKIAEGVNDYEPSNNRSETKHIGDNHFLLDAYNANPSSMEAAIDTFATINHPSKVILLGDMFEMGNTAMEEHRKIAEYALSKDIPTILTGSQFAAAITDQKVKIYTTTDELIDYLKSHSYRDTWFLVKGSRGMKMERVLEAFE